MSNIESGVLVSLLGRSAIIKTLDFLISHQQGGFSKAEIARQTGLGRKTINRIWPGLKKYRLLRTPRRVGRSRLYLLDDRSQIALRLTELASTTNNYEKEILLRPPDIGLY